MDAVDSVSYVLACLEPPAWLTFEELFAGILLEECLVDDGLMQIIKHKLKDRLNLLLAVAGKMH